MGVQKPSKIVSAEEGDDTDVTQGKHSGLIPWKVGQSGNIRGRPRGSRSRISEKFLTVLERIWDQHGEAAMVKAALAEPMQFTKMVAGLLPSKVESSLQVTNIFAELNLSDPAEFGRAWDIARAVVYGTHMIGDLSGQEPEDIEGEQPEDPAEGADNEC
jgi:hypothetical protein